MPNERVIVVGAGIGGLVTALLLASRGLAVVVLERAGQPGGKMRQVNIDGKGLDAGPTVFTMREVFEDIFAAAGTSLSAHLRLRPLEVLARHAWNESERLDLYANIERSADAIGDFSGASEARRFLGFCRAAQDVYQTLEHTFIRASRPSPISLTSRVGVLHLDRLWRIRPFATMWKALCGHFRDPRLRQLFGRYATYCGSSPFLAPATLMLIAHVEQAGVWTVEGGMHHTAATLARLAAERGAVFRYDTEVSQLIVSHRRASGVELPSGERIEADAIVLNADVGAVSRGLFGDAVRTATPLIPDSQRSLSALTLNLIAETEGFPLLHHSVFFSRDYPAEFDAIFRHGRLPADPTVYICAQDRHDSGETFSGGAERLLCLINAPPVGDTHAFGQSEIEQCEARAFSLLESCGLRIHQSREKRIVTTPVGFHRLFPATGGALYGQASHGWRASFRRSGTRTKLPGLYLAGGSVHPGAGVPMAAVSGQLAATCVLSDLTSTSL